MFLAIGVLLLCFVYFFGKKKNKTKIVTLCDTTPGGGGVLDFGLDGGVPLGPWDPNPCLE